MFKFEEFDNKIYVTKKQGDWIEKFMAERGFELDLWTQESMYFYNEKGQKFRISSHERTESASLYEAPVYEVIDANLRVLFGALPVCNAEYPVFEKDEDGDEIEPDDFDWQAFHQAQGEAEMRWTIQPMIDRIFAAIEAELA
ncbi:MAG: hypothetical protein NC548_38165 [Lachnospiraceae bacterium]|nr:hypothetical protein [Lachnospiraceae bacterium]